MNKINIKIPKGYEIDIKKSNLQNGEIGFKKTNYKELPKSFTEVNYTNSSLDFPLTESSDYSAEMQALNKLLILRDIYNDGWEPNWENKQELKFVIIRGINKLKKTQAIFCPCMLVFKTAELRDMFFKNFHNIIYRANILL